MVTLQTAGILVGVITGVAGSVLGVMNYLYQRSLTRPRIRVRPRVMHLVHRHVEESIRYTEKDVGVMEIANIGRIPVYMSSIGFKAAHKGERHFYVVSPERIDRGEWPCEIPPGHVVALRMMLDGLVESAKKNELGRAYASSAVDEEFLCKQKDLEAFVRNLLDEKSKSYALL